MTDRTEHRDAMTGDSPRLARPWVTTDDAVRWPSAVSTEHVLFDNHGVARRRGSIETVRYPWAKVTDLSIFVPYTSLWQVRLNDFGNCISPIPYEHASDQVRISFTSRFEIVEWALGRADRYSWRVQFVLTELLDLLNSEGVVAVLGEPGALDRVVDTIAPLVPGRARPLMYADAPFLTRHLGGPGALTPDIRRALHDVTNSR